MPEGSKWNITALVYTKASEARVASATAVRGGGGVPLAFAVHFASATGATGQEMQQGQSSPQGARAKVAFELKAK